MFECVNIPISLLKDERLSLGDVQVYAAIVLLSGENKKCSSTRDEIQKVSGVQRISRHTQNLFHYGHIRIEKIGDGNRNTYAVLTGDEMSKPKHITLEEFKKEFLEYSSGVHSRKTIRTHKTAFREFIRVEGNKPLQSIGIREIEHFLSKKKQEASEWTARKYYGSLASAFEKAVHWELIKANPFRKVKKPKPPEVLPLFFSEEEFNTLLSSVLSKEFRDLCITALLSGLRLAELLNLRWNDLDFTSKVIQVKNSETFTTKSRKNRIVPMSEELFRLLKERKENVRTESAFVFHNKKGKPLKEQTISQQFKKYVISAGVNNRLHFHSLRHSFATHLVKKGVPLFAIQKLLGHSTSKTTEIYSHLLPQQLHREVNILAGLFNLKHSITN
jgi:integrase/recombinase XerD